jgi:hypothetical protein
LSKKSKKKEKKQTEVILERKPWISKSSGLQIIVLASVGLAVWVAYQIIRGSGEWGTGILWGLIFGGAVFLVYFGMYAFHTRNVKKRNKDSDQEKK